MWEQTILAANRKKKYNDMQQGHPLNSPCDQGIFRICSAMQVQPSARVSAGAAWHNSHSRGDSHSSWPGGPCTHSQHMRGAQVGTLFVQLMHVTPDDACVRGESTSRVRPKPSRNKASPPLPDPPSSLDLDSQACCGPPCSWSSPSARPRSGQSPPCTG